MTIVVGIAAPDGIVLAGDSRTTLIFGERHRIASDYAQKVFRICDVIGVATYGDAFVGPRTIAGLMDEFVSQLELEGTPEAATVAESLGTFFDARVREAFEPELVKEYEDSASFALGFMVAGYGGDGIGRIFDVGLPGPSVAEAEDINTSTLGVLYRGQYGVVRRLFEGVDRDELALAGIQVPAELDPALNNLTYNLLFPTTLQDAVDCARFMIRTTIDMQRFSDGTLGRLGDVPGCGGPVRLLAVTRDGAEWVLDVSLSGRTTPGVAEGGAAG